MVLNVFTRGNVACKRGVKSFHGIRLVLSILFLVSLATTQMITPSFAAFSPPGKTTANAQSFPFVVQTGTPAYLKNTFHPVEGCKWLGVAGQVFGTNTLPLKDVVIRLGGKLGSTSKAMTTRSGSATFYGSGGYEFVLASQTVTSNQSLWTQIYDEAGNPLSEKIYFNTFNDCTRNLVLINFSQRSAITSPTPVVLTTQAPSRTPTPVKTTTPVASLTSTKTATTTVPVTPFLGQYVRQPGSPVYQKNFAHPDAACNWMGIAGQVFGTDGKPVNNLVVEVEGRLDGKEISGLSLTSRAQAYGSGGYEIVLANRTLASQNALSLTLYDLKGNRLTSKTTFNTYADCNRNLVVMNFIHSKGEITSTPTPISTPSLPTTTKTALPSASPTQTPTPTSSVPTRFTIQQGAPFYLKNIYHPEKGCAYMGIGGQVFGVDGMPIRLLIVEAGGTLAGKPVFGLGLTGASPRYGYGGYEVILSDAPTSSKESLWVVLKDLKGRHLSEHIYVDTFKDCSKNLILLNFQQLP